MLDLCNYNSRSMRPTIRADARKTFWDGTVISYSISEQIEAQVLVNHHGILKPSIESSGQQQNRQSQKLRPLKTVTFSETSNLYYESVHENDEVSRHLWYTTVELKKLKDDQVAEAKIIAQQERTIRSQQNNPDMYQKILQRLLVSCYRTASLSLEDPRMVLFQSKDFQALKRFIKSDRSSVHFVGMERVTIRNLSLDRKICRRIVIDAVLSIQQEQTIYSCRNLNDFASETDNRIQDMEELNTRMQSRIASVSSQITHPGSLFAMAIAHARFE